MTLKAYKYRLYPTNSEQEMFMQHFGVKRFAYNTGLAIRKDHYACYGNNISKRKVQDFFVALKKTEEFSWLGDVNSQSILAALDNIHRAYNNFFKGLARFPRFKSRKDSNQSYQCPQHVQVDCTINRIKIPKIGWVKAVLHREFVGEIKTCTISKTADNKFYISVLVKTDNTAPVKPAIKTESTKGYDLGLTDFLISDDGTKIPNNRFLGAALERLAVEQKKLARKNKGSNGYTKQKQEVAKLYCAVTNKRKNFLHQISNKILSDNQAETVALEDLNVKGLIRNKKLARHIADVSWGKFVEFMKYKAEWRGKNVIFCDRFAPSSKQCSCGAKNNNLKLSDRSWICSSCGTLHDRDILAANNIKKFALAKIAEQAGIACNVKCTSVTKPISVGVTAKGAELVSV